MATFSLEINLVRYEEGDQRYESLRERGFSVEPGWFVVGPSDSESEWSSGPEGEDPNDGDYVEEGEGFADNGKFDKAVAGAEAEIEAETEMEMEME